MLYTRAKHIVISARESENMSMKSFTILYVQAWKSNKFQITRFSASEIVTFNDRVFLPKRHTKFSPEEQTTNMRNKRSNGANVQRKRVAARADDDNPGLWAELNMDGAAVRLRHWKS